MVILTKMHELRATSSTINWTLCLEIKRRSREMVENKDFGTKVGTHIFGPKTHEMVILMKMHKICAMYVMTLALVLKKSLLGYEMVENQVKSV